MSETRRCFGHRAIDRSAGDIRKLVNHGKFITDLSLGEGKGSDLEFMCFGGPRSACGQTDAGNVITRTRKHPIYTNCELFQMHGEV